MPLELWLPSSAEEKPKFRCRICQAGLHGSLAYEQHVAKCGQANEAELHAGLISQQMPGLFGPQAGDPEYESWVYRHGRVK